MIAVAGYLHLLVTSILATLATIVFTSRNLTQTGNVFALFLTIYSHRGTFLFISFSSVGEALSLSCLD